MRGIVIAATLAALLAGCSAYDSVTQKIAQSITPYWITVVQGNFVSAEAAAQMQVGMSRDQVKQLLGTPILTDMFHADRWDYVFYFKRGSTSVVQQRDFVVNFASDRVVSWSGGENLPSNLGLLAEIDGDKGVRQGLEGREARRAARGGIGASGIDGCGDRAAGRAVHSAEYGGGLRGRRQPGSRAGRQPRNGANRNAHGPQSVVGARECAVGARECAADCG